MQTISIKALVFVVSLFFFTSNLSGSFLPIYFKDAGLSIAQIIEILLVTFLVIGFLPVALLKRVKNFERIIAFGIFATLLFYLVLVYVRDPVILGLAYGVSTATFWPSFNLLQFRLSESKVRARTVSLFSSIIPSIASIVGPATGGFIIESFGFSALFSVSIILYLVAFLFSVRIRYSPETHEFSIPRNRILPIFFVTFILLGLSEAYWLAYPFFVQEISGSILHMGFVLTISAVIISAITYLVNWFSDIKKARVEFAVTGSLLHFSWFAIIGFASTTYDIVVLSLISGLASAFSLSWFAYYADCFGREHYASILVMMEVGLMIGRIINLAPTYLFVSQGNYASYFLSLGIISLGLVPFFVLSRKRV